MKDYIITQAISTVLYLIKDKKLDKKWLPGIIKIRDAAIALVPLDSE